MDLVPPSTDTDAADAAAAKKAAKNAAKRLRLKAKKEVAAAAASSIDFDPEKHTIKLERRLIHSDNDNVSEICDSKITSQQQYGIFLNIEQRKQSDSVTDIDTIINIPRGTHISLEEPVIRGVNNNESTECCQTNTGETLIQAMKRLTKDGELEGLEDRIANSNLNITKSVNKSNCQDQVQNSNTTISESDNMINQNLSPTKSDSSTVATASDNLDLSDSDLYTLFWSNAINVGVQPFEIDEIKAVLESDSTQDNDSNIRNCNDSDLNKIKSHLDLKFRSDYALFPTISQIRHSCAPNCIGQWDEKRNLMTITVSHNHGIKNGDEIFLSKFCTPLKIKRICYDSSNLTRDSDSDKSESDKLLTQAFRTKLVSQDASLLSLQPLEVRRDVLKNCFQCYNNVENSSDSAKLKPNTNSSDSDSESEMSDARRIQILMKIEKIEHLTAEAKVVESGSSMSQSKTQTSNISITISKIYRDCLNLLNEVVTELENLNISCYPDLLGDFCTDAVQLCVALKMLVSESDSSDSSQTPKSQSSREKALQALQKRKATREAVKYGSTTSTDHVNKSELSHQTKTSNRSDDSESTSLNQKNLNKIKEINTDLRNWSKRGAFYLSILNPEDPRVKLLERYANTSDDDDTDANLPKNAMEFATDIAQAASTVTANKNQINQESEGQAADDNNLSEHEKAVLERAKIKKLLADVAEKEKRGESLISGF